jgi:tryptophan-rich sensory protein
MQTSKTKSLLPPLLAFGALTTGAALAGTRFTLRGLGPTWYGRLRKPSFQPPRQAFGPVWTLLYGLIAASAARVYRAPASPARTRALALWGAQLSLNVGWTYLFFSEHRPRAALAEILVLEASIAAYLAAAYKVDKAAAWMVAPYLAWTGFAGALNGGIVAKNRLTTRG